MADTTYAVSKIVRTSSKNVGEAIQNGIDTAAKSLRHLDWFEVTSVRGNIKDSCPSSDDLRQIAGRTNGGSGSPGW